MIARLLFAAVLVGLLAVPQPVSADDPPPKKATTTEQVLAALRTPVKHKAENINDIPLMELLTDLSKQTGVTFIVNEESFKAEGLQNIREAKPNLAATRLDGFTLRRFLVIVLPSVSATFLVRRDHLEVCPAAFAVAETKARPVWRNDDGPITSFEPLVSEVYKGKPLNEVVADWAEEYDQNLMIAHSVGDRKMSLVTGRFLNVPISQALDLIAVQADLRAVQRGNAYLITTPEQAKALADEDFEKTRRELELAKLRGPMLEFMHVPGAGPVPVWRFRLPPDNQFDK